MHFLTTGARVLAVATAALGFLTSASHAQSACGEKCLKGFMDSYLQALAKHDPASLALAGRYRYTENGATLELGKDALWVTFNAYGPYRHDVFDPSTGGVATYVSLTENHEIPFPDL